MKESPVDSDNSEPGAVRSSVNGSCVRFGAFEISLDTGELRKHGVRVRLQRRPFHILQALIERPGQVVSREELRSRLWSSDTFVDFESGLNTAINRLRTALGDSAENPLYIETLALRFGKQILMLIHLKVNQTHADSTDPQDKNRDDQHEPCEQ